METYHPNRACTCTRCRCRGLTGPVVLVVLGALFLLDSFNVFGFDRSWPLLLIAIGGILLLQRTAPMEDHVAPNVSADWPPGTPATPDDKQVPHA